MKFTPACGVSPNSKLGRLTLIIAFLLCLTHCAPTPPKPQVDDAEHQRQRLAQLHDWQLQGKLGIRLPDDNGSARLSWRQSKTDVNLSLSGPLGRGRIVIEGNAQQVSLKQAGEPELVARDVESLLYQATGWQLPVSLLSDWVKGIPAPDTPRTELTYTPEGLLSSFEQSGWRLSFKRHQWVDGFVLPGYVRADKIQTEQAPIGNDSADTQMDVRLVLSIHQWNPGLD
ncbi:lipoprotein insertase outer membrane protein LolB [Gilvimarinus agarilyticus]|uniref:lipoprotein insertase outer membrane protein LolB n=1 Tax=unclassified Gilvimarinus TaxID=2642066 RepID=UPI001C095B38|nr:MULTISPECIES: lipoprotein insertase outer membrane protein LolB [unclassified Gilvimarinus]MBU2886082.1 lipoprotein insertase outer membrane protein LolB [Gilvimarinus agarilyticus]MDO6570791.1 lipoprotein insertase outer membrane protein LolB [Gilvimarinus sp. 2_MG-2023]MDO6746959.1 lipoprotein insertase outer membrane protein LolB [Gilvimarinus sp. 1_MG-2023]